MFSELNIYFWIAQGLLTLNAFLYTHSILKNKDESWKVELCGGVVAYFCFAILMFKMST